MDAGADSETARGLSIVSGAALDAQAHPTPLTIPAYLSEISSRFGEREALAWPAAGGVLRWSYAELRERSLEVARALVALGLGKDGRVGILVSNRPEFLAAAFGTALAGGVAVPLNTFSTPRELAHLIAASRISVLLFERRVAKTDFAAMLAGFEPALARPGSGGLRSARFPFLRRLVAIGGAEDDAGEGSVEAWPRFLERGRATPPALVEARADAVRPSDAGAIFFSSGTTSRPKGVLHAQRAVALQWWRWPPVNRVCDGVRAWSANGLFWSGNFSMMLGTVFGWGGTLVLQSVFDAEEALALIQSERVNYPYCWPHQWARLEAARSWNGADLGSVRYVDASTPLGRHPRVGGTWHEPPAFGTTETLTIVAAFASTTPPEARAGAHGVVLPGNTLKIVDPRTGGLLPRGMRGEIAVKGPSLLLGYLGVPAEDCFDAEGFFHTGDGGFLDAEGRLFWEGRLTEGVKTGGANVSPREVDGVIGALPGVRRCQTLGLPHDTLGEMLVCCIVPQEGAEIDEDAVRRHARESLASYKVPRRVFFFRDEEFGATGSGKLKTAELRQRVLRRLATEEDLSSPG